MGGLRISALAIFVALVTLVTLGSPSRSAAVFPGPNGEIMLTSDRNGTNDLYTIEPDGSKPARLFDAGDSERSYGRWGDERGEQVIFVDRENNNDDMALGTPATGEINMLTSSRAADLDPLLDEGIIALFATDRDGDFELRLKLAFGPIFGSRAVRRELRAVALSRIRPRLAFDLTDNQVVDRHPDFASEGRAGLLYTTREGGDLDIVALRTPNSPRPVIAGPADERDPALSPDGTRVAYVSNQSGNPEIYVADSDGRNRSRLTVDPGRDTEPAFSPDGKMVAFTSDRDGNREIYAVAADGAAVPVNLTNNPAEDFAADWRPEPPPLRCWGNGAYRPFRGSSGPDSITGRPGRDLIRARGGRDTAFGNGASDCVFGAAQGDLLFGNNGDDSLSGGAGFDRLSGGQGRDLVFGDSGGDRIRGGAGRNYLDGGAGDDRIRGGPSADSISAVFGRDVVNAGAGRDFIVARRPKRLRCGPGRDFVLLRGPSPRVGRDCERVIRGGRIFRVTQALRRIAESRPPR